MNNLIMYALKTIRYRSLIAEALLGNLSECEDTKRRSEIITVCHRSADVIEHISQYVIEDCLDKHQLIQDLESALFILDVFSFELDKVNSCIPDSEEIKVLMAEIGSVK
ncbi:hypothetical protein DU941_21610 [Salmonella enterica subsp. enterica serovar Newport]|nr:hypothetical protein [Salmonella enterica subsp. enterica serovar Newport]